MLGTDPGSKFQGASFLFQHFGSPKIKFGDQKMILNKKLKLGGSKIQFLAKKEK